LERANPAIGTAGGPREIVEEIKLEVLVPRHLQQSVLAALKQAHPYEEVAYDLLVLANTNEHQGAGMVGELLGPLSADAFLALLKEKLGTPCIRHTAPVCEEEGREKTIQRVAICGGAGSFLLSNAIRAGADAFVTGDFKYHEFFGADGRLLIADVGHWESEQYTTDLIITQLRQKLPNFAAHPAKSRTNPVHYYF
jgi:putative NIF3 family GTP cyclohydrolase 1 type 2